MNKIKEIKKFVIEQMKKAPFKHGASYNENTKRYLSDYIEIKTFSSFADGNSVTFNIKGKKDSCFEFDLSDIKMSKIRFTLLMIRVKNSANSHSERHMEKSLSSKWDMFLDENKDINRDIKVRELIN